MKAYEKYGFYCLPHFVKKTDEKPHLALLQMTKLCFTRLKKWIVGNKMQAL